MSTNSPPYTIVSANAELDKERILSLWRRGLTHAGMPEAKFDWYYRENPDGPPQTFFLYANDVPDPVGVAAIATRHMHTGTKLLCAGELVDFVALPEYRTLFPALFLQKEIRRIALETNQTHSVLYGFPNPKSLAVVKRVGYQLVGQMVRHARVVRSAGYLSRTLPGWLGTLIGPIIDRFRLAALALRGTLEPRFEFQWLEQSDTRLDNLWQRVIANNAASNVLIGVRDNAFLKWRFSDCPLRAYRFFAVISPDGDRAIAGYAVCALDEGSLLVHDFLYDTAIGGAAKALWRQLTREAYTSGHTGISVEFFGTAAIHHELLAAGFSAREKRPVYAAVYAAESSAIGITRTPINLTELRWYLTCADEDG
jgi:hypothetical protein